MKVEDGKCNYIPDKDSCRELEIARGSGLLYRQRLVKKIY
jgi:hypothetical protein